MNILNEELSKIKFADVVEFCEQQILEGVALEYKSALPKDLSKQFVTFSNTQGGLIIIGIEEDKSTGLPSKWEGVESDGKLIDRIYQFASNVIPYPSFDVEMTNESDGKVFILIRIAEGSATPYSTNSDPTPWIRTGNISTPIVAANRDDLLSLLQKREKAASLRESLLNFARNIFDSDMSKNEEEWLIESTDPEAGYALDSPRVGDGTISFEISTMPFYPNRDLMGYKDFKNLNQLLSATWQNTAFISENHSIPGGKSAMTWRKRDNHFTSNQIYFNGLVYTKTNVQDDRITQIKERVLGPHSINHLVYYQLSVAREFYAKAGYNGQTIVNASILGSKNARIYTPVGDAFSYADAELVKLNEYNWEFETNTTVLADDGFTAKLHAHILKRIYWDLGLGEIHDTGIMEMLRSNGWYGLANR